MKSLHLILTFALSALTAAAGILPSTTNTWNVLQAAKVTEAISLYQGDTMEREYLLSAGASTLDLSATNLVIRWDLLPSGSTQSILSVSGEVVNGTNGHIRLALTSEQSSISNQSYIGYVRAVTLTGTAVVHRLTLIRQTIEILFSGAP